MLYYIFSSSLIIQGAFSNLSTSIFGSDLVMEVGTNVAFLKACKMQSTNGETKDQKSA